MADNLLPGLILLTYKGKALLMNRKNSAIDEEKHPWCFIGAIKGKDESFEKAMVRRVEKETGIKVENIKQLSKLFYHADLSDDNVNKMKRAENQLLDFFNLREINKLSLTHSSKDLIQRHGALI